MEENSTGHNSGFKKLAVQWLIEALCFVPSSAVADSLVLRIKLSGKNPAHRKSAKRYRLC